MRAINFIAALVLFIASCVACDARFPRGGGSQPSSFTPPGTITDIAACNGTGAHDASVITTAMAAAGSGNTARFKAGTSYACVVNSFTLTAGVYLYADPAATVTLTAATPSGTAGAGNTITGATGATVNGSYAITTSDIIWDFSNSTNVTLGNVNIGSVSSNHYDRIQIDGSSGATIINNNIESCGHSSPSGSGCIGAYTPTAFTISGDHFNHCYDNDCIDMPYGAGANSSIVKNVFQNDYNSVMEIGYGATTQATTNFLVDSNWANDGAAASCTSNCLKYSIPVNGTGSTGNTVSNNYADGTYPSGQGKICIEFSQTGTVSNNQCNNFNYGGIGYSNGATCTAIQHWTNNNLSTIGIAPVLDYNSCGPSVIVVSGTTSTVNPAPPQPTRTTWGGQN